MLCMKYFRMVAKLVLVFYKEAILFVKGIKLRDKKNKTFELHFM